MHIGDLEATTTLRQDGSYPAGTDCVHGLPSRSGQPADWIAAIHTLTLDSHKTSVTLDFRTVRHEMSVQDSAPTFSNILYALVSAFESTGDTTTFQSDLPDLSPMPPGLAGLGPPPGNVALTLSTLQGLVTFARAKAQYVGLPTTYLTTVRDQIRPILIYSDHFLRDASARTYGGPFPTVQFEQEMPAALWNAFSDLGMTGGPRVVTNPFFTFCHEMTHVWMHHFENEDPFWEATRDHSQAYFQANDPDLDPWSAYMEAAGSYVEARMRAWYNCVSNLGLDLALLREGSARPDFLKQSAAEEKEAYDVARGQAIYGTVAGVPIKAPIPDVLRQALDVHILESYPLVKSFIRIPALQRIYEAIRTF